MKRLINLVLAIIAAMVIFGCSNASNPALPAISDPNTNGAEASPQSIDAHRDLWGWWTVSIDPVTRTVEIVPFRSGMFRANVTQWMQPPGGSLDNLKIMVVDMSTLPIDGRIAVDVSLTHPFTGMVQFTGFDVNGIFLADGPVTDSIDPDILYAIEPDGTGILENPDGYTRWFNYPEFSGTLPIFSYTPGALGNNPDPSATLNPYKYFADGLGAEDDLVEYTTDNPAARGQFSSGVTNTRRYNLQFPIDGGEPHLEFQYAVSAVWEPGDPANSGNPDTWDLPGDFPFSANQQEPFLVNIDPSESSLYFEDPSSYGGELVLDLEVYSWQALDPAVDVFELARINISACETCNDYPVATTLEGTALDDARVAGSGTVISSVWHVEIADVDPAASGMASFLVSVEPANPTSYDQGYGVTAPDGPLAAYRLGWVEIADESGCIPPTAYAEATTDTDIFVMESVTFDASATTGTPPFTWDWDWDGDGTYDEQTDQPIISHQFDDSGTFDVMCKAINACGEDEIDAPIQINVSGCGTGLPTYSQWYDVNGPADGAHFYDAIDATINDPDPKLIGPGMFWHTGAMSKIFLHSASDPVNDVISHTYSGGGEVGYYKCWLAVDGTTSGTDRIFFVSNISPGRPIFVDWDGSDFSNETELTSVSGIIYGMTTTEEGDLIAYNGSRNVYLWDKQNSYAQEFLFQFQNTSDSVPWGTNSLSNPLWRNLSNIAYDPETQAILFAVHDMGGNLGLGQLFGLALDGTQVFADTNVFETNLGGNYYRFGVTVDTDNPYCRVLFHGAPNGTRIWIARFIDGMQNKVIAQASSGTDDNGATDGCIAGGDFWTNTNNWSYGIFRRTLPADW